MIAKEAWKGPEAQAAYADLLSGAEALLSAETDWLANLANAAALVLQCTAGSKLGWILS